MHDLAAGLWLIFCMSFTISKNIVLNLFNLNMTFT